jgi:uncharacterized membrane protein YidH (DUF202 family)
VAALLEALAVRRPASRGLAAGVAVATLVFGLSAYLPGTEESLVSWAGLSVVLAAGVAGLVTAVLVARAVLRRTRAVHDIERGRRSPATLAVRLGSPAGSSSRWRRRSSWTVPTPASGSRSRW